MRLELRNYDDGLYVLRGIFSRAALVDGGREAEDVLDVLEDFVTNDVFGDVVEELGFGGGVEAHLSYLIVELKTETK